MRRAALSFVGFALVVALAPAAAAAGVDDWLSGQDATGTWDGARTVLEDHGLHIDLDYTAESFTRDFENVSYRGNLDFTLTFDTAKGGWWKGGTLFGYLQDDHGDGPGDGLDLVMPVSNYESDGFTQLSELWIYQELPKGIALRLGKQDANRDFAAPRFPGNFVNSSYGVLPTAPMPSFPAPALGAALFLQTSDWLSLRGGVFDGAPRLQSFDGSAFEGGGGVFTIGALRAEQPGFDPHHLVWQAGGWHLTGDSRSGGFAIVDLLLRMPERSARSHPHNMQLFVRCNFEPDAHDRDAKLYVGGGVSAHGFAGANNTFGIGSGYVSVEGADETFVELFFKWRPLAWFTIEPDLQVYFVGGETRTFLGLRTKLKL